MRIVGDYKLLFLTDTNEQILLEFYVPLTHVVSNKDTADEIKITKGYTLLNSMNCAY